MIFNAYSVLAAFVGLVQAVLGVTVAWIAFSALRARRAAGPVADASEGRLPLLRLMAIVLLGVSLASWPLLYLLWQSYVPQWPGVMCIQGVTRIGRGSLGASGWLPSLVAVLQWTKPALVFVTGAWLLLHAANHATATAPWTGRVLVAALLAGALATIDATAEVAYVTIPKKETFLARGCCTVAQPGDPSPAESIEALRDPVGSHKALSAAFFATSAAMAFAAWRSMERRGAKSPTWGPAPLLLGALVALPVGLAFLSRVAAPTLLPPPAHACAYCLLATSPAGVAGIVLYMAGLFSLGWAGITRWLAPGGAEPDVRAPESKVLLSIGLAGFLGAILVAGIGAALA